jgi:hypothetical protein
MGKLRKSTEGRTRSPVFHRQIFSIFLQQDVWQAIAVEIGEPRFATRHRDIHEGTDLHHFGACSECLT